MTTSLPMWLQWVWALAGLAAMAASGLALYQAWQARRDLRRIVKVFDGMLDDGTLHRALTALTEIPGKLDKLTGAGRAPGGTVDVPTLPGQPDSPL